MLRLIPKERFEKYNLGKQPNYKVDLNLSNIEWPYFEIPEIDSWLIYIKELKIGLIFGIIPKDYSIDYSDWNLEKLSDKPNPKYILNIMKSCVYLKDEFFTICGVGEWMITNSRFDYNIKFSIKICGTYYKQTAIGYEEKLKIPIDKSETRIKDKLIEHIGNGLRSNNKEGCIGS